VFDALADASWITDIKGALTLEVLAEYLELCDFLSDFSLQAEVEDVHVWQFSTTGQYTNKSAYEALFIGATSFGPWKQIWKSWAPGKCKFFLWIAALNRIWTADRLARKGLSHPAACPLCDQAEETADHLLVACVFSRQVWFTVLQTYNLQTLAPLNDLSFLIGGWPLAIEWMVWLKKALTPFLFWEPGPSGSITTAASLMGLLLMCLVLSRSSKRT